jgi:hypothetical protein
MHPRGAQPKLAVIGLALLTCFVATNVQADLTPQERLDAIRQGLVDASLQTPTRVQTTTWIDNQGSLRETNSFKNALEVNSVRVVSYDRDDKGQPKAKLQFSTPQFEQAGQRPPQNTGNGTLQKINKALEKASNFAKQLAPQGLASNASAPVCKIKASEKLKHTLSLDLQTDSSANPVFLANFLPLIQYHWIGESKTSGAWRMVNSLPAASMSNNMTRYERALLSNRPESLPWNAKLLVRTEPLEATGLAGLSGFKGPDMLVHLQLQVSGTEGQGVAYEDETSITIELDTPAWSQPKLKLSSINALQSEINVMRSQAEEWLACQSVQPMVTAAAAKQIEINAGALAGVKKGDEWLVANPARFPAQLMSKDGAPQTLLAQVQSVTPFNSQLLVLAGPAQSVQANWRAWPTETLVKEPQVQPSTVTTSKRANKTMTTPAFVMTPY